MNQPPDDPPRDDPRYFERPDPGVKPLTLCETLVVVLTAHLGVRTAKRRHDDFRRANGLHVFIAGVIYFALLLTGLVLLVSLVIS